MYNLSKLNRVISKGYEEPTGRTCMEMLAGPVHQSQSEVCEGQVHSLGCDSGPLGGCSIPPYLCSSRLKGECCASYSKRTLTLQSSPSLPSFQ